MSYTALHDCTRWLVCIKNRCAVIEFAVCSLLADAVEKSHPGYTTEMMGISNARHLSTSATGEAGLLAPTFTQRVTHPLSDNVDIDDLSSQFVHVFVVID